MKTEALIDMSANLREGLLSKELDLVILLGPASEFTVESAELPALDLAWYRPRAAGPAHGDPVEFTTTPVTTCARGTRPFRELESGLLGRFGPYVALFPASSLESCVRLVEDGIGVAALPRTLGQRRVDDGRVREFDPGWLPNPPCFAASLLGEPRRHMLDAAVRLARDVAKRST